MRLGFIAGRVSWLTCSAVVFGMAAASAEAQAVQPNFAKMPDIEGIRLGMTAAEVLPKIQQLYPANQATEVTVSYARFHFVPGTPWVDFITVHVSTVPGCSGACTEDVRIVFNSPPDQPRVVSMTRALLIDQKKETTVTNMETALRQKFGQELPLKFADGTLYWIWDEQGNLLSGAKNLSPGCTGAILTNPPAGNAKSPGDMAGGQTVVPIAKDVTSGVNPCRSHVYFSANMGTLAPNALVQSFTETMSENDLDTRATIDTLTNFNNFAAGAQQQQQKHAQQQSAPTL